MLLLEMNNENQNETKIYNNNNTLGISDYESADSNLSR